MENPISDVPKLFLSSYENMEKVKSRIQTLFSILENINKKASVNVSNILNYGIELLKISASVDNVKREQIKILLPFSINLYLIVSECTMILVFTKDFFFFFFPDIEYISNISIFIWSNSKISR